MSDDAGQALEFKYIAAVFRAGVSAAEVKRWILQHMKDLQVVDETKKAVEKYYNELNGRAPVKNYIGEIKK